jgi:vancomycin resistance protein YoaR
MRTLGKSSVGKLGKWLTFACLVAVILIFSWGLWVQRFRVPYGTFISDVGVGALRWQAAREKINEFAKSRQSRKINFTIGVETCKASLLDMGAEVDVDATYQRLESESQRRGMISRLFGLATSIRPVVRFDPKGLESWREVCEGAALVDRPVVGKLVAKGNSKDHAWVIEPPKAGRRIAIALLGETVSLALTRLDDSSVALPIEEVKAYPTLIALEKAKNLAQQMMSKPLSLVVEGSEKKITLLRSEFVKMATFSPVNENELSFELSRPQFEQWLLTRRHRVEQPARNATYELDKQNKLTLVPEAAGSKIAVEALYERIQTAYRTDQTKVEIPFEPTELPKLRTSDIEHLNIHELVSSFTTRHACCQPRVKNIHRIADLLNGVIVLPGSVFSINETIGPRTLENGFVAAPSIQDGDMMDTIGGGISQFATTFYNAAMRGGYEILERQAHSYWFDRYPMGHEATLSWPKPDLIIRNDTQSGLLILTSYDERSITVKFYGDKEGRVVTFGVSPRTEIVLPKTEYLPNPEVSPDKEEIKEGGCIGWTVTTTRTVIAKDKSRHEDKRKVVYKPRIRRVEVHPCKIPAGEPGATGEKCPKVEPTEPGEESSGVTTATTP